MKTITVKDGQNIYDIALQHAGSVEAVGAICNANDIAFDADLIPGNTLMIPSIDNEQLRNYYRDNEITIATGK
jgi:hypothetical protein